MRNATPGMCFFCSKRIAPGTRAAFVTVEGEYPERVYHLDCFTTCRTGSGSDRAIWTYRIVDTPTEAEH